VTTASMAGPTTGRTIHLSALLPVSPIHAPVPTAIIQCEFVRILEKERTMNNRCCRSCAYAVRPVGRWYRVILSRWPGLLTCLNHPDAPGGLMGVAYFAICPNFRRRYVPPVRSAPLAQPEGSVRYIPLTQGKYAIVDAEDYERVSRYKWCLSRTGKQLYAQRRTGGKTIRMHQFIMKPPKGMVVDHIDGNGLNNRRSNLRICTRPENTRNRRRNPNTASGYKGVWHDKKTGKY
jgi:hypothetical protein